MKLDGIGLCLEAWHINSAYAPKNHDDGGLLPDDYLQLVRKKAANQWSYGRAAPSLPVKSMPEP